MKKATKIILIVAAVLIGVGILFSVIGFVSGASLTIYPGEPLNLVGEETADRNLAAFEKIDVNVGRADVEIIPANAFGIEMTDYKYGDKLHYAVENGVLKVGGGYGNHRGWFNLDFSFIHPKQSAVKIYVPEQAAFTDVSVTTALGRVDISNITTERLTCLNNLGEVKLSGVTAQTTALDLDLGALTMENADLGDATIESALGEVTGKDVSTLSLNCTANMGKIDLQGTFIGVIDIDADMGDVNFETTVEQADYSFDLNVNAGKVLINGSRVENEYRTSGTSDNKIKIGCAMGDINVKVQQ